MEYHIKSNIYDTVEIKCAKTYENVFLVFISFFCCVLVAFSLLLTPKLVVGSSMYPTLNRLENSGIKDVVYIVKQVNYNRGDIVVLAKNSTQTDKDVIKRIVAVAGDKVAIIKDADGYYKLCVNDEIVEETYIKSKNDMKVCHDNFEAYLLRNDYQYNYLVLQKGEVFVLGDNRAGSFDSSSYGARKASEIEGRVFLVVPQNNKLFDCKIIW